ncbi:MAG TPA: peptide chain release factor N(5)-glutamine methyltransferase [Spongiibacteraceae bacterium]|nr:peptide chain release factor N(5)-glutamine methyltransferase [Spongiibacteraceae bacterium]
MQMLYRQSLEQLTELTFLPDKPEETPETTLCALWHAAAGAPKSVRLAAREPLPELDAAGRALLYQLITKRIDGVPLAHITQRQCFMDLEMLAGPEALVPRRETELLAGAALAAVQQVAVEQASVAVVDVCTGSGNVALAIAQRVPNAKVYAADLSEDAVALARRNAQHLGLEARAQFFAGDLLAPFETEQFIGKVDVLTCNPPYINSAKVEHMASEISAHEPRLAFDGGPFGVAILMRLLQEAPKFVRPGGWLIFEVGLGQGPALIKRLEKNPAFHSITPIVDEHDAVRAISVRLA